MSGTPKILTLDIETSPHLADVWGLWQQNVSLSQLREVTKMIAFAAKWHGEKKVEFRSTFHDGQEAMVQRAYELLDQADIVIHFNGATFDMPHLRREFILAGFTPHSPVQEVDLLRVVKSRFRFASNKLDHVSRQLGLAGKVAHTGHDLWVRCMAGDEKAWALMKKYNIQDVRLTEELYDRLRPWVKTHPHMGLLTGAEGAVCARCNSENLTRQGYTHTSVSSFQRYKCNDCGSWSRSGKAVTRVDVRGTA